MKGVLLMTLATYVIAVVAACVGAFIAVMVMRGQGASVDRQVLDRLQRLAAIFENTGGRGRAGEIALQNLLEANGMSQHCDFELQVQLPGGRPDVVLSLPGRGRLCIDAKFPLDDFQRAVSAATDKERRSALEAHGEAVSSHVTELAKRDYPSKLPDAMDFVVCYVPSDELVAAAYEARPALFRESIRKRVLITGPAALMSILWGVAYGLQQDARFRHAQQVGQSVAELHRTLGELVEPLQKLRGSMGTAVRNYNGFLTCLEGAVLPNIRELEELGIFTTGTQLPKITPITTSIRPVAAESYTPVNSSWEDQTAAQTDTASPSD
jgi:DNA recombination protein RmuC